jgi:hypothetical protein
LSLRQVACHLYKNEIAVIAGERANGAKAGGEIYLSAFQGAVNTFMDKLDEDQLVSLEVKRAEWMNAEYPIDYQRKNADRSAHKTLLESAENQYKEMGMRSVVWEFHENKEGVKLFQL